MADSRFFEVAGPLTLRRLCQIAEAELGPDSDPEQTYTDVAPLETAGPSDVSFLDNRRYLDAFANSRAGACVLDPAYADRAPQGMGLLLSPKPYRAYALIARAFYPEPPASGEVHETAVIDPTARIGASVTIGPYAVIGRDAEIGDGCQVGANAVIGAGVQIGEGTWIGPSASISHCLVGKRCQIHAGVRLGNRGFGFTLDPEGYLDVPQLGRVIIEDDVEIGANSTVDRGAGPDTVIGAGSKIDNLVQIGHNVQIGRGCVLVAQSGVAGSSKLDDYVMLGAQGGIAGHLSIGKGAQIAAQSGVMRDVEPGASVCGAPAIPIRDFFRMVSIWQRQLKAPRKSDE